VSLADASKALYHTLSVPSEEAQRVFRQIDTTGRGHITFSKYEPRCIFFLLKLTNTYILHLLLSLMLLYSTLFYLLKHKVLKVKC
jgi:hypothetical protein